MNKWNILGKIDSIQISKPGRILVFETTGFSLYGAVASCSITASFTLSPVAVSTAPGFDRAMGEVLDQLRDKIKGHLPKTAVLITPSAAGGLLSLPVDPQNPRPRNEIKEMVRWELEEIFVRQNDIWSLGALLMGRGYLTPEQRTSLESGAGDLHRGTGLYGEVVTEEQLDECLVIQEQLVNPDDNLVPGWVPQNKEEETGPYTWYGACVGDGIRGKWVTAFNKHGIYCTFIYPQLGAALPLIPSGQDGWVLLDIRQEQTGIFAGNEKLVEAISIKPSSHGIPDVDSIIKDVKDVISSNTRIIFLSAPSGLAENLSGSLETLCSSRNIKLSMLDNMNDANNECPVPVLNSIKGTARHALKVGKSVSPVRIEAREPKPPVWKNRALWPWAAIILLVLAIGSFETSTRFRANKYEWDLELLDIEYNRRIKLKEEAQSTNAEASRLNSELHKKEEELKEGERLRDILKNVIRYRQDLVPGILESIADSVNDGVILELLEENQNRSGFYIKGWAIRDTEGQLFGDRLNKVLETWNYKVADNQLERGRGKLGIKGFNFRMWLVKTEGKAGGKND